MFLASEKLTFNRENKMDFNNLKLFRKKYGYTQEQIAERIGVSRQAVAKWENGVYHI